MFGGLTVLVGCNASLPSRHILIIDTYLNSVHCFSVYIFQPLYTVGLQYQATWRALCLGLRIRHVSRGVGKVLRSSKNPLNSQGPRSLVVVLRPLPPVSETRESPRFSRSAYLRFLLRPELPPVQGPRAFGFRGPCTSD